MVARTSTRFPISRARQGGWVQTVAGPFVPRKNQGRSPPAAPRRCRDPGGSGRAAGDRATLLCARTLGRARTSLPRRRRNPQPRNSPSPPHFSPAHALRFWSRGDVSRREGLAASPRAQSGHRTLCRGGDGSHPAPHSLHPSRSSFTPRLCLIPLGQRVFLPFAFPWGLSARP